MDISILNLFKKMGKDFSAQEEREKLFSGRPHLKKKANDWVAKNIADFIDNARFLKV